MKVNTHTHIAKPLTCNVVHSSVCNVYGRYGALRPVHKRPCRFTHIYMCAHTSNFKFKKKKCFNNRRLSRRKNVVIIRTSCRRTGKNEMNDAKKAKDRDKEYRTRYICVYIYDNDTTTSPATAIT